MDDYGRFNVEQYDQFGGATVFVQVNDDLERQRNVFRKMVRFAAFVSFPAMLGLAFVAEEFICATIGNKWLEVYLYYKYCAFKGR